MKDNTKSTRVTKRNTKFEKIIVAVRVRPMRSGETRRVLHVLDEKVLVMEDDVDKNDILRQKRSGDRQYAYDAIFKEEASQEDVYMSTAQPLVSDVLGGFNATVFAYGATGSGKTHTMVGDPHNPGIMVRALNDLFLALRLADDPEQYQVKMSYMEIYNENIRDLLNPGSGCLELREDSRGRNIQVARLSEVCTSSTDEVMALLQKGNRARTVEPTAANRTSSRSHALLSVSVRQAASPHSEASSTVRHGRLFMVDLAGSERASRTQNRGKRLQEGAHINRSLLALGNCINALHGGARFVNYRDSKLTRLLKDALSGNCRTVMVAHISPVQAHREETRTTLLYAQRASNISKKVERNVLSVSFHVSQYRAIISDLREEISRLHAKMGERPHSCNNKQPGEKLLTLKCHIVAIFGEQMRLRRQLMELDSQLLGLAADAERQQLAISMWECRDNKLYRHTSGNFRPCTDEVVQEACEQLEYIHKETDRCLKKRENVERELEKAHQKAVQLEDELPRQISSEEERELLGLMCRVHELEAEKIALQSERLSKQHELRRRDLIILHFDRQRHICEEIITRQRQLMEEGAVMLTPELQHLYALYQNELHATAYTGQSPPSEFSYPYASHTAEKTKDRLPRINQHGEEQLFQRSLRLSGGGETMRADSEASLHTPDTSSGDSEYNYSPVPGTAASQATPPTTVIFPPLPYSNNARRNTPRHHTDHSIQLERTVSDDNIASRFEERKGRPRSRWRK